MKLVRFKCGCIGTDDQTIVKFCSNEYGESQYTMMTKEEDYILEPEKYTVLDTEETEHILNEIFQLIQDGHKFRQIKSLWGK